MLFEVNPLKDTRSSSGQHYTRSVATRGRHSKKGHRIGRNDPVAGVVSIATMIDVASELGADGGDQHGGQLIFQHCS